MQDPGEHHQIALDTPRAEQIDRPERHAIVVRLVHRPLHHKVAAPGKARGVEVRAVRANMPPPVRSDRGGQLFVEAEGAAEALVVGCALRALPRSSGSFGCQLRPPPRQSPMDGRHDGSGCSHVREGVVRHFLQGITSD